MPASTPYMYGFRSKMNYGDIRTYSVNLVRKDVHMKEINTPTILHAQAARTERAKKKEFKKQRMAAFLERVQKQRQLLEILILDKIEKGNDPEFLLSLKNKTSTNQSLSRHDRQCIFQALGKLLGIRNLDGKRGDSQ